MALLIQRNSFKTEPVNEMWFRIMSVKYLMLRIKVQNIKSYWARDLKLSKRYLNIITVNLEGILIASTHKGHDLVRSYPAQYS